MNFDLSEEQTIIRASLERFAAPMAGEARRKLRQAAGGYDRIRWRELADLGLVAIAIPEAAGGMGGSTIDLALLAETIGRMTAPDPWLENGALPAKLLAAAGREDLLEPALTGDRWFAFAFAERSQRYDLTPKAVVARAQDGGFVLRGEKTTVLGGALADAFIVSTDCEGEAGFFLVPADHKGLIRRDYRLVDGSVASELRLLDAEVDAEARLAISPAAFASIVADIRLLAAAEMLGLSQRLFDDTLQYVKEREQFGVAIGSFQALQHRLVECYAAVEQARSMIYRAALAAESDAAAHERTAAGAKAFVGEQADHVAREAVQMHGGMGITDELAIGHAVKRILLLARLFGDSESMLAQYAEAA